MERATALLQLECPGLACRNAASSVCGYPFWSKNGLTVARVGSAGISWVQAGVCLGLIWRGPALQRRSALKFSLLGPH